MGDIEFDSTDGKTGGILNPTNNSKFVDIILSIFLIVWFGIGQYWVFDIFYFMIASKKRNIKRPS